MAKPKAERWLTESFAAGAYERWETRQLEDPSPVAAYYTAQPWCWLAQHDPKRRPCVGRLEVFHFIPRQRVENALWDALQGAEFVPPDDPSFIMRWRPLTREEIWDAILLAAWDPRNGALGCEHHHRRFDGHATSPRAPKIVVPHQAVPRHVHDFVADYGLETTANERFPGA